MYMSHIKDYLMDIEEGRIVPGELQEKCVCSEHFSDFELQGIIRRDGRRGLEIRGRFFDLEEERRKRELWVQGSM